MHTHQHRMLEDFIGQVKAEQVSKQPETVADGAIFSAKFIVGRDVQNDAFLA